MSAQPKYGDTVYVNHNKNGTIEGEFIRKTKHGYIVYVKFFKMELLYSEIIY